MKKIIGAGFFCLFLFIFSIETADSWGFFAHKQINRIAVFTLPTELIGFYKDNIEFITEHAVDPDKRRYAVTGEAERHFIDLDRYRFYSTQLGGSCKEIFRRYLKSTWNCSLAYRCNGKKTYSSF